MRFEGGWVGEVEGEGKRGSDGKQNIVWGLRGSVVAW